MSNKKIFWTVFWANLASGVAITLALGLVSNVSDRSA